MPFNFEIEGDWNDPKTQAYDKPKPKEVALDDSEPSRVAELVPPPISAIDNDDVRIRQLEASMQELFRKIRALEQRLGVSRDD